MGQKQVKLPKDDNETSDDAAENLVESDSEDDKNEGMDVTDGERVVKVSMCVDAKDDITEEVLKSDDDQANGYHQTEACEETPDVPAVHTDNVRSTDVKKSKQESSKVKHRQLKTFADDNSSALLLQKPIVANTLQEALDKAALSVKEQNFFSEELETVQLDAASRKEEGDEEKTRVKAKRSQSRMKRFFKRKSVMKIMPEETLEGHASVLDLRAYNNPITPTGIFDIAVIAPPPEFEDLGEDLTMTDNREIYQWLMEEELIPAAMADWPLPKPEAEHITPTQLYNSMNDGQKSCYLFDPSFLLIIDVRMKHDYSLNHINTAHHFSELQQNPSAFEPVDSYTLVVVYDELGMSYSLTDSDLSVAMDQLIARKADAFVLEGGFRAFQSKHPYLCTSKVPESEAERQSLVPNYPSIIIEDQLYLGRVDQACQESTMKNLKISYTVCITQETTMPFQDFVMYHHIKLTDEANSCLHSSFPDSIKFIIDAIDSGGRVFVHCNLGQSRSATLVIAYLMFARKWTLDDAYNFVKEQRPVIHPNEGFMSQLLNFEKALFGKRITKIDIYGYTLVCLKQKVVVDTVAIEPNEQKVSKKQKYKLKKSKHKEKESDSEQHTMMDYEKLGNESDSGECEEDIKAEGGQGQLDTSLQMEAIPSSEQSGSKTDIPALDVPHLLETDPEHEGVFGRRSPSSSRGSSPRYTRMSEQTEPQQGKKSKKGALRKILVGSSSAAGSGDRDGKSKVTESTTEGDDISLIGDLNEEINDCTNQGISNIVHRGGGSANSSHNQGVKTNVVETHGMNFVESSYL